MRIYRPLKAIRLKCIDCCAGNMAEVKRCDDEECTLYPYRMGHRPKKPHVGGTFSQEKGN